MSKRPLSPSATLDDSLDQGEALSTAAERAVIKRVFPRFFYPAPPVFVEDAAENTKIREEYMGSVWDWWLCGRAGTPLEFSRQTDVRAHWTVKAVERKKLVPRSTDENGDEAPRVFRVVLKCERAAVIKRLHVNVREPCYRAVDEFSADVRAGLEFTRRLVFKAETLATPYVALIWDAWATPLADGVVDWHFIEEDVGRLTLDARWYMQPAEPEELAVFYFTMWFTLLVLFRLCGAYDDDRHLRNYALCELDEDSLMYNRVWAHKMDESTTVYITPNLHKNVALKMFDYGHTYFDGRLEGLRQALRRTVLYFTPAEEKEDPVQAGERVGHISFNPMNMYARWPLHAGRPYLQQLVDFALDPTADLWSFHELPLFRQYLPRTPPKHFAESPIVVGYMPPEGERERKRTRVE